VKVGLILPRGGGPSDLTRAGQWPRFCRFYLRAYAEAFDRVALLVEEEIDPSRAGAERVEIRRLRRSGGGRRWDSACFAGLDALRAFQAPDLASLPAGAPPAAATFGFDYRRFARFERRPLRGVRGALRARAGAQRAALLFVPARFLEPRALALAPGARAELLPNGADLAVFTPPERLGPARRALYVGRLEPQKGLQTLLHALARLPSASRPSLTLVGEGGQESQLRRLSAHLGLNARFTGVIPHDALPAVYAAHDLFVLPSLEEGQPKALIEAMACGLACVASDCEGNRSLVEDGRNGWLFQRREPTDLAALLGRLMSLDSGTLFRIRRAARRSAESRHDLRLLLPREVALVQQLARSAAGDTLEAKYARCGAYHWRETDPRHQDEFNAPLRARYRALAALAPRRRALALDAGCGDGALAALLIDRCRQLVGCDLSMTALRLARARVPSGWWVRGRLEALPFRGRAFDLALAADVLEHAEEPRTAASELSRVLSPRGDLLASAPVAEASEPRGRFHRLEFGRGALADLLRPSFELRAARSSHAGWLMRLYGSRPFGRGWARRLLNLLAVTGVDPFRWPAGAGARQTSLRASPRTGAGPALKSPAAAAPATNARITQVAGDMNRKCG
jgi:glycosyltransferase involved in cell wall biosynthesis